MAASWECWDPGWIPSLAQWVKDLALQNSCGLDCNCGLDMIPGLIGSLMGQTKKGKKRASLPVPHVSSHAVALPGHMVTLPSVVARTVLAAVLAKRPWWAGLGTHCSLKHRREDMQS